MRLFDFIIRANTALIGFAMFAGLVSAPFVAQGSVPFEGIFIKPQEEEASAVVAGAFVDNPPTATPTPSPTPTPTPVPVADPVHIEIPALQLATDVVHVGVTPDNVMEVPTDFNKVGWFNKSLKPGEQGTRAAIMSGHFDTSVGGPAVFHLLETLEHGDTIFVTDATGNKYTFEVIDVFTHPLEDFPTDIVYGETQGSHLKLITCDGVWDAAKGLYSDRLVVTTKLIDTTLADSIAEAL